MIDYSTIPASSQGAYHDGGDFELGPLLQVADGVGCPPWLPFDQQLQDALVVHVRRRCNCEKAWLALGIDLCLHTQCA